MSRLHQLTAVQSFSTHHRPDYRDYQHYVDKGRLLRSRFWWHGLSSALPTGWRVVRSALTRLRQQRRRQLALRELYRLDDRTLLDIGVDRSRIDEVVDSMLASEQQLYQPVPVTPAAGAYQHRAITAGDSAACNDETRRLVVNA